jgi:HPt (histidine-containing phosphotransfer) domain-containing protein
LRNDAAILETLRQSLQNHSDISLMSDSHQSCVYKLAGAAGVFDLQAVSKSASALEEAIIARRAGGD